jgi:hypothetical protein
LTSKISFIPELEKATVRVNQISESKVFIHVYVNKKTKRDKCLLMADKIQKLLFDLDLSSYVNYIVVFTSKSDDGKDIARFEDILNPREWDEDEFKSGYVTLNEFEVTPYLDKPGFGLEAYLDGDNYVIPKSVIDFWDSL